MQKYAHLRKLLSIYILGSHHSLVLAAGVVADFLHILKNLAQKFVLVLVRGLWPNLNIFEFQAIRVYDERQQSIGLATVWRTTENSVQSIGKKFCVTSFFIYTLPFKFIEFRYE